MRLLHGPLRGLLAALLVLFAASVASADTEHTVRSGQTLSAIARRYHVPATTIARANGLGRGSRLRVGQVLIIPTGESVTVARGDTLQSLARRHGIPMADLARVNGLRTSTRLRPGQRLVIPEGGSRDLARGADAGWGRPRSPGVVSFLRNGSRESYRGRLVDPRGRARTDARRRLARLMRDDDGSARPPNPRLLAILTRISDHFGGRRIQIVSGYRKAGGYTRDTSRHTQGDAMDIRIEGVPITAIRDYCRTLSNVGCGYYPTSRFVHVDVRDRSEFWIDWSGPGQAPRYSRPEGAAEPEGDGSDAEGQAAAAGEGAETSAAPTVEDPAPAAPTEP